MHEFIDIHEKYAQLHQQHFYENVIFSYQWWFLILTMVILWSIWAFLVDKRQLHMILLTGLLSSAAALTLDEIGISMALWVYPYYLIPFSNVQYPIDIAIIPVFYMLLYQYFKKWKSYLIVLIILTLFAVIIVEPLFVWLGIYKPLNWNHWLSAPGYMLLGTIVKGIVDKVETTMK